MTRMSRVPVGQIWGTPLRADAIAGPAIASVIIGWLMH